MLGLVFGPNITQRRGPLEYTIERLGVKYEYEYLPT